MNPSIRTWILTKYIVQVKKETLSWLWTEHMPDAPVGMLVIMTQTGSSRTFCQWKYYLSSISSREGSLSCVVEFLCLRIYFMLLKWLYCLVCKIRGGELEVCQVLELLLLVSTHRRYKHQSFHRCPVELTMTSKKQRWFHPLLIKKGNILKMQYNNTVFATMYI